MQEVEEEAKSMGPDALLKQKVKQKRFRDGYGEGLSSLHKQTAAAAFIASEQPVEMLGQYTRLVSMERHCIFAGMYAEEKGTSICSHCILGKRGHACSLMRWS